MVISFQRHGFDMRLETHKFAHDFLTQPLPSFPRRRESILGFNSKSNWIPACAGMTVWGETNGIYKICTSLGDCL